MTDGPPRNTEAFRSDPVLRLLPPDVPESFLALPAPEQAWRGRAFLIAYASGFPIDYAWWWALTADDVAHATVAPVPDVEIPKMVAGRVAFDAEIARQTALGGQ